MSEFDQGDNGWKKRILESVLIVNIKDPAEVYLVDFKTGSVTSSVSENGIRRILNKHEAAEYYEQNVWTMGVTYDPHAVTALSADDLGGELFNVYQPPDWKRGLYFHRTALPPSPQALPSLYDRYLTHLVNGNKESLDYLLDWLATALRSRNFTILTAIGEPGIGKGKLGEIMSGLVGQNNFTRVRDTIFKKQFNAPLKYKQIVYVDEVAITTQEEADRVKDVVNSRIEIEQKGQDAQEYDNFASFYLTSNRMDAIKIESSDRRFSIIELTDKSLLESMKPAEIGELTTAVNIQELALYLLGREIKSDMMRPFRSMRFEDVREAGLLDWELWLMEEFFPSYESGAIIDLQTVRTKLQEEFVYMKRPPGRHRFESLARKFPENLRFDRIGNTRQITIIKKVEVRK